MENMGKGLTQWVLIVHPKIPQIPQNVSAQFVCPNPKVLDFNEKKASLGVCSQCPQLLFCYVLDTTYLDLFSKLCCLSLKHFIFCI